jgi:hypothetical protein
MRYRLRTLMIVVIAAPPIVAGAWWALGAVFNIIAHTAPQDRGQLIHEAMWLAVFITVGFATAALPFVTSLVVHDKRYRARTMLLLGMVTVSALAASAFSLESRLFADLTDWHGGGGLIVEVFSREIAASLTVIPCILALVDLYVVVNAPAERPIKGIWGLATLAYFLAVVLCEHALRFAQSARE